MRSPGSRSSRRIRTARSSRSNGRAIRIFDTLEQARLDTDCRGYLVYLEHVGILSPTQRELVIDRLMALDGDEIDIEKLKWVVLMVLFSQPGQETAYLADGRPGVRGPQRGDPLSGVVTARRPPMPRPTAA